MLHYVFRVEAYPYHMYFLMPAFIYSEIDFAPLIKSTFTNSYVAHGILQK